MHKLTKLVGDLIFLGGNILLAFGIFTMIGVSNIIYEFVKLLGIKELNPPLQILNLIMGSSEILCALMIMGFGNMVYCVAQIAENTIPKDEGKQITNIVATCKIELHNASVQPAFSAILAWPQTIILELFFSDTGNRSSSLKGIKWNLLAIM